MTVHNPNRYFSADLSVGLPALFTRMLVDSPPGWIDFLPATPGDWPVGKVEGLHAHGLLLPAPAGAR
jgi:alpha-L-fucosidase 2